MTTNMMIIISLHILTLISIWGLVFKISSFTGLSKTMERIAEILEKLKDAEGETGKNVELLRSDLKHFKESNQREHERLKEEIDGGK